MLTMEIDMDYKYTDTDKTEVALGLTLGDIASLRMILEAACTAEIEGVSKWRIRETVRKLSDAQAKAADAMAREARELADKAKLSDEF